MAKSFVDDWEKMRDFKSISKEEFLKSYSYLTEAEYDKTKKVYAKRVLKELHQDAIDEDIKRYQRPIESITITIEWKKSSMYGYNPKCQAEVQFKESDQLHGRFERSSVYTCSGCGYDKESTVIAKVFNDYLAYKLYQVHEGKSPYGMYYGEKENYIRFNGGVGTNCYYNIAEFIGGSFEKVASGKSFDVYKYTDKRKV